MNEHNDLWLLLADKLAGEESEEELKELQALLLKHPLAPHYLQLLSGLWKPAECNKSEEIKDAFIRHLQRMLKQHKIFIPDNLKESLN